MTNNVKYLHELILPLVCLCKVSVQSCLFCNWVVCFHIIDLKVFFIYSECKSFQIYVLQIYSPTLFIFLSFEENVGELLFI